MVKLSQCMIVKDEECNIEKALSWGRDFVFEQIVVDTGSSDRTVEIAQSMGAKISHFEWVNDFAAAKNYAIEQATGDWIAFLDADEYFTAGDAAKVLPFLEYIHNDASLREKYLAVFCPWIHLDDNGCPIRVDRQMRLFRNLADIRYVGRIHEWLSVDWAYAVTTEDFSIMHTGYAESSYKQTGKAKRNIEILRAEVLDKPDDMNFKAYLADSLMADAGKGTGGEIEREEAMRLYREVIGSGAAILPELKKNVYSAVLDAYTNAATPDPELDKIGDMAYKEFPDDHTYMCYKAMALNKNGDFSAAFELLQKCERSLDDAPDGKALTTKIMGLLSSQMILAAQGTGDLDTVLKYASIQLMMDKTNLDVLRPYIALLMKRSLPAGEEVIGRLAQIYDFGNRRDIMLIARAAKDVGAIDLARRVINEYST